MSTAIPADIKINESMAASIINEQFAFDVQTIKPLGEGWDNMVYLINNDLAFRFPRRKVAVPHIAREIAVLSKLAGRLPLDSPVPLFLGKPSLQYPFLFYGHKIVKGQSRSHLRLSATDFNNAAKTLANFLCQLHKLDLKDLSLKPKSLGPPFDRAQISNLFANLINYKKQLAPNFSLSAYDKKIETILDQASNYVPDRKVLALVHADLYHRHLLFDEKNCLTGIIDWGDTCASDPVVDLAVIYQFFPKKSHQIFFNTYGEVSEDKKNYARFLGLYYAVILLWFGSERHDKDLVTTSLRTLEII